MHNKEYSMPVENSPRRRCLFLMDTPGNRGNLLDQRSEVKIIFIYLII